MTSPTTTQAQLGFVAPFFIVRDVRQSIAFYKDRLGFDIVYLGPDGDPYYAMVHRDGTKYFLDGMLEERGASLREPYADAATQGRGDWDDLAIEKMLDAAAASGDHRHTLHTTTKAISPVTTIVPVTAMP